MVQGVKDSQSEEGRGWVTTQSCVDDHGDRVSNLKQKDAKSSDEGEKSKHQDPFHQRVNCLNLKNILHYSPKLKFPWRGQQKTHRRRPKIPMGGYGWC